MCQNMFHWKDLPNGVLKQLIKISNHFCQLMAEKQRFFILRNVTVIKYECCSISNVLTNDVCLAWHIGGDQHGQH